MSLEHPSMGSAYYKMTAAKLNDTNMWAAQGSNANMAAWCGDNTYIGDPYPNGGVGWGSNSCPNCGSYTWGGLCGCGTVPMPGPVPFPNGGWVPNVPAWPWTGTSSLGSAALIVKGKEKADILGDFFGPEVHALVILDEADGGARFVPFMDKLNMIWLQETLNSWAAYDRDEFLTFVNSDQTMFFGTKLNKAEVLKRMMKPENPPESAK